MDIDQIVAFVTAADLKSITHTADQLHLTQPAVTKRIQNLEKMLGSQLFDRTQKSLRLTETGERLLPSARNLIHEAHNLRALAQYDDTSILSGELSIVCSHHIGLHRLPPVLKRFCKLHPSVKLSLSFIESEKVFRTLQNQQCDIAFVSFDDQLTKNTNILYQTIDPLHIVCANDHPMTKQTEVSLGDLARYDAILPDTQTFLYQSISRVFSREGVDIRINMTTNYLETIKMMVAAGLGWSVMPQLMIDEHLSVLDVERLHLERRLGILSLKNRVPTRAAIAFVEATRVVWGMAD